jgi:hypothetical protein
MMSLVNGQERTYPEFIELGKASGWKCEEKKIGQWLTTLVFSPA